MTLARDAREATIRRWLPTLDEARLRRVEELVLELAIEQQNEAIERGLAELRDAPLVKAARPGVPCEWDLSDVEGA